MSLSPCEEFFGFSHRPFRGTPDAQDYVELPSFEQEISRLVETAVQGDGVGVITAAHGAGKTVVCERLRTELQSRFEVAVLSSSGFATRRALLQAILFALSQSYENFSEQELRLAVLNFARTAAREKEGVVLIVDEAHLLNARLLEELRCLTNHSEGGLPLVRVILCGQLPLEETLVSPGLEALNYRITCHATIEPLTMHESAQFVSGRLLHAGRIVEDVLTPDALETICRVCDGSPRCLVQLCDQSLAFAAETREIPVSVETVRLALKELKQLPLQWNESAIDEPLEDISAPVAHGFDDAAQSFADEPEFVIATDEERSEEDVPNWSESVSTAEVGDEVDVVDTWTPSSSWSSFEPDAANDEIVNDCAAPADEVEDATCESIDTATATAPAQSEPGLSAPSVDEADDATGEVEVAPSDVIAEIPVEDTYAELDNLARQSVALPETGRLAAMLDSLVTYHAAHRESQRLTDVSDSAAEQHKLICDPESDPAHRIDEMIAALTSLDDDTKAKTEEAIGGTADVTEWKSSGEVSTFDVVEPDGVPQWRRAPHDQSQNAFSPAESADHSGQESTAAAVRREAEPVVHYAHSPERPYLRLFSRLRKQRS